MAVCIFKFNWQGIFKGLPASGSGCGTTVLVCESGKWQLITEHLGPGNKTV